MSELDWAAGLFEGEGCFSLQKNKNNAKKPRHGVKFWLLPRAHLRMTDEDSVRRFHAAVGVGKVYGPYGPYQENHKEHWEWTANGFEKVQAVVAMLWNGLGQRRRARAADVLREGGNA